jgi:exopolysaccharide biosynthesis protein
VIVSSKLTGRGADALRSLAVGERVALSWSGGMSKTIDVVGGHPILVRDGTVVAEVCDSYLCQRHPRTALAISDTGEVWFVVVDGRKSSSVGMTPRQLGLYLKGLGVVDAVNLDGGGSSAMWIDGLGVVNDPSGGDERDVANFVALLPGPDPDQPSVG